MGGETYPITVFGFQCTCNMDVNSDNIHLGSIGDPGIPVYFGPSFKDTNIEDVNRKIQNFREDDTTISETDGIYFLIQRYNTIFNTNVELKWMIIMCGDMEVQFDDNIYNFINEEKDEYEEEEDDTYDY